MDFHDARNRQLQCHMIMRPVEDSQSACLACVLSEKLKSFYHFASSEFRIDGKRKKEDHQIDGWITLKRVTGVSRWRTIAPDRARWRRLCETAVAFNRL
ncbi:hypothetical protein TNCV_4189451 [Trichonephila clavipes]|nr:hypothetical protein TNCV_4189451 [Trichonephila clavipes]